MIAQRERLVRFHDPERFPFADQIPIFIELATRAAV